MSHVLGAGSVRQGRNAIGKRLGVKKYAGEFVKVSNIIIRQRGSVYHAGKNSYMADDYTIHAAKDGYVAYRRMAGFKRAQYYVDVLDNPVSEAK